jgi:hypothetical protein
MSRLRLAEYHYGKAAEIHPHNAVLLGCVGMVSWDMWSLGLWHFLIGVLLV